MQTKLPKKPSAKGPADWFTGEVYFDVIAPGTHTRGKVNAVHFAPGARTAWHRHANGQTLYATEGVCRTQSRGGELVEAHPVRSSGARPASGTGTERHRTTS
jgi:quercetin dioxygenase-like cupin family protein